MVRAITSGLSSAFAERRLVLLLWTLNLGLALVVAVPFWLWGWGALGTSVEAHVFATGWDGAAFADLMEESSAAIVAFALVGFVTVAIAGIGSAFVSSGALAVLVARARAREAGDGERTTRRAVLGTFFEGGGRFFWRNVGVTALSAIALLIVVGVAYGVAAAATRPLENSLTEGGAWIRTLVPMASGAVALLVGVLVLDFARLALVASDRRGVWRTWTSGARFVRSHLPGAAALTLVFGVLTLVAAGLYLAATGAAPSGTGTAVIVVAVLQQLFMLWRSAMRVGLVAGQLELATVHAMPGVVAEPAPAFVPPAAPVDLDLAPAEAPVDPPVPADDTPAPPQVVETATSVSSSAKPRPGDGCVPPVA